MKSENPVWTAYGLLRGIWIDGVPLWLMKKATRTDCSKNSDKKTKKQKKNKETKQKNNN